MDIDEDNLTLDDSKLKEIIQDQLDKELRSDPTFRPGKLDLPDLNLSPFDN